MKTRIATLVAYRCKCGMAHVIEKGQGRRYRCNDCGRALPTMSKVREWDQVVQA